MSLSFLEETWKARPLAQLKRPGNFFDFTRYRPLVYQKGEQREFTIPNTFLRHARSEGGEDWILAHALEPHAHGEDFVEGFLELMKELDVGLYGLIGSMYAPVPHTRPPIVSGTATNSELNERLRRFGMRESNYEGPTTILSLITREAQQLGIDTFGMVLQLPAYSQVERDYRGLHYLLRLMGDIFDLRFDLQGVRQEMERQTASLNESVEQDPRIKTWVREMEALYDAEISRSEDTPKFSSEMEQFLKDIERRWDDPT